jgi:hypothetical protein
MLEKCSTLDLGPRSGNCRALCPSFLSSLNVDAAFGHSWLRPSLIYSLLSRYNSLRPVTCLFE